MITRNKGNNKLMDVKMPQKKPTYAAASCFDSPLIFFAK